MKYSQLSKIVIKPIHVLLSEGWEKISWGWIKNRAKERDQAHNEISYYQGIEDIFDENRTLTVRQDDGGEKYLHCVETNYHVAKGAIAFVR